MTQTFTPNLELETHYIAATNRVEARRNDANFVAKGVPYTTRELIEEITYNLNIDFDTEIGVLFTVEWAMYFAHIGQTNVTVIVDKDCVVAKKMCDALGFKYVIYKKGMRMRFDVVVGNPPYQEELENTTGSKMIYDDFVDIALNITKDDGTVAMIIPSDWMGPKNAAFKKFMFNATNVREIVIHEYKKYFSVAKATCHIVIDKTYNGIPNVTDGFGNSLGIDLTKESYLSNDLTRNIYKNAFGDGPKMDYRWRHGSLYLNQVVDVTTGVEFVKACGRANGPMETAIIDPKLETTGYGSHKVLMPNVGGTKGDLGNNVKVGKKEQVFGHSVVGLLTNSDEESKNLIAFLRTTPIAALIKTLKSSSPNSKYLFANIPDVDLTVAWTDELVIKHFGLSSDMIDTANKILSQKLK